MLPRYKSKEAAIMLDFKGGTMARGKRLRLGSSERV